MLIQRQGDVRPYRRARTWLVATSILASGLAAPALAQNEPPPYTNRDANGVDLVTGQFGFVMQEGSIGTGENRLELQRILLNGARWTDNWTGTFRRKTVGGNIIVVLEFGAISDSFQLSGGTYLPSKADGSSLVALPFGNFRYTARDGTTIEYQTLDGDGYPVHAPSCNLQAGTQSCGLPVSITKPNGATYSLDWSLRQVCDEDGEGDCPNGQSFSRLMSVRSPSGNRIDFAYGTDDPGIGVPPDAWFTRASATFVDANEACATSCPSANYSRTYHSGGSTLTVSDLLNNQWQFTGVGGRVSSIRRPGSATDDIAIAYGTAGVVTSITKDGVTTGYARSVSGSTATTTVTDALSQATVVEADLTRGRVTSLKNPLNQIVSHQFDVNGRLTRTTQPEGNYVEFAYDARGNLTQTTRVDKAGTTSNNLVTSASYASSCANAKVCNQPNSTTDERGKVTDYTYDTGHGGVLTVTQPAATSGIRPQSRYGYSTVSGISLLTSISACQTSASCAGAAEETKSTATYDAQHRLMAMTMGAGDGSLSATTAYGYDAVGNVTTIDGPLPGTDDTVTYRYDAARRATGVISVDPDGSGPLKRRAQKITYDGVGRVAQIERGTVTGTDDTAWAAFAPAEKVTTTWASGRRAKDILSTAGTDYAVTQYSYDATGRPECVAQRMNMAAFGSLPPSACSLGTAGSSGPDRIVKTHYDAAGRASRTESAMGTADQADETLKTFTDNGQIASLADGKGNKTTYEYDGHDRLKKARYPDPAIVGASSTTDYEEFSYDAGSNVTATRLRDGQVIGFTYDDLSRLTLKDLPGSNPDTSYSYDLLGRMTGATETGGQALSFGYDALGRNISAGANLGTLTYQYDLAGRRTRLTHPDGLYFQYDYLGTGEVTAIRENGATSGAGVLVTFAYDDLGRRTALNRANGTSTSYAYDPVSRLASLGHDLAGTTNDVSFSFTHDPASGIVSRTGDNDLYAFSSFANINQSDTLNGLNQVTGSGGTSLAHDTRGNITGIGSASYGYDIENRMTSGGAASAINYDPLGRLRQIVSSSLPRGFLWDGNDAVLEYDENGQILRRYVHGPGTDEPLVTYGTASGDKRWLHADERGSIISLSDASGTSLITNRYDDYGVPAAGSGGRFGYTGQLWLPELGMSYYKARIYNPALGRFMQPDPIGYGDGLNLYAYTKGNPLNRKDSLGLCSVTNYYEDVWGFYYGEWRYLGRNYLGVEISGCDNNGNGGGSGGDGGGGGGGGGGGNSGVIPGQTANTDSPPCPRGYAPMNKDDAALFNAIYNDKRVADQMVKALRLTAATGNEWSFWIYRANGGGFRVGGLHEGTKGETSFKYHAELLGSGSNRPVAGFHTHPGGSQVPEPSLADSSYNRTSGTLGIIGGREGIIAGRGCR